MPRRAIAWIDVSRTIGERPDNLGATTCKPVCVRERDERAHIGRLLLYDSLVHRSCNLRNLAVPLRTSEHCISRGGGDEARKM